MYLMNAVELVVIKQISELISVFNTTWFVKTYLAGAPQNLQAIDDISQYIDRSLNSDKTFLNLMQNHFWYLTDRFIVL